jgi:hypothetical protein
MSWWKAALGIGAGAAGGWALPLIGAGLGTFGQIWGGRQQGNANKDALRAQERASQQAMAIEQEQMAEQRRQFDQQQALARQQWDTTQKFEQDRWAASEEERLYDRRLKDERETRMAPRRAASAQALANLPSVLASGRTSPGLASLGSYRSK